MKAIEMVQELDESTLIGICQLLTGNILDPDKLRVRIREQKRLIEMRKDPNHEAWMEQR